MVWRVICWELSGVTILDMYYNSEVFIKAPRCLDVDILILDMHLSPHKASHIKVVSKIRKHTHQGKFFIRRRLLCVQLPESC